MYLQPSQISFMFPRKNILGPFKTRHFRNQMSVIYVRLFIRDNKITLAQPQFIVDIHILTYRRSYQEKAALFFFYFLILDLQHSTVYVVVRYASRII